MRPRKSIFSDTSQPRFLSASDIVSRSGNLREKRLLTHGSDPPLSYDRPAARLRQRRLLLPSDMIQLPKSPFELRKSDVDGGRYAPKGFRRRRASNPGGRPRATRKRISRPIWWNSVTTLRRHLPCPRQPVVRPWLQRNCASGSLETVAFLALAEGGATRTSRPRRCRR